MSVRTSYRRLRLLAVTAISVAALVAAVVAVPAFAHDTGHGKKAKCQEMKGMDMCGNGVYKGKKGKTSKPKVGTMVTIDGALTGDSPCEKSGPPASVGQVSKDAEGHDHRGPLYQYPVTPAEREALIQQQTEARAVAVKYPTVAAAEAAGYRKSTPYVPCIGAHYTNTSLVATFNLNRLQAWHMSQNELDGEERGVIIDTASVAAFEGQIGQVAYTAAKAGVAAMMLPMARDLGSLGIRSVAIAPSLFLTGITSLAPEEMQKELTRDNAFPRRMGKPEEYAQLALAIVRNPMLNGSCIRLDAGVRFAPK